MSSDNKDNSERLDNIVANTNFALNDLNNKINKIKKNNINEKFDIINNSNGYQIKNVDFSTGKNVEFMCDKIVCDNIEIDGLTISDLVSNNNTTNLTATVANVNDLSAANTGYIKDFSAQRIGYITDSSGEAQFTNLSAKTLEVYDTTTMKSATNVIGSRRYQTFSGSLQSTNAQDKAYSTNECLVELGTLDVTALSGIETPTKIFIHKAVVVIKTTAGNTLVGNLALSNVTGRATNQPLGNTTEIVGADVTSISPHTSADAGATEIDIDFNTVGAHVFGPNILVDIAYKYLYARNTTAVVVDIRAGRFTVELEYSIL